MSLPVEIVVLIISYLDDIQDIRNCLEVSKEIRDSLFKTPIVMRKIKLVISKTRCTANRLEFVKYLGKFIRCLRLNFIGKSEYTIKHIIHHVKNLEELDYENQDELYKNGLDLEFVNIQKFKESIDLPRLKKLNLKTNHFNEFMKNIKSLNNLEEVCINLKQIDDEKDVVDFLLEQQNLKKLSIKFKFTRNALCFPSQDISKKIKFQLKVLKFKFNHKSDGNFLNFFQTQAKSLEKLDVKSSNEEFLEILFNKCKKLTNLTFYGNDSQIYSDLYSHLTLENVKYLTDYGFSALNLNLVYKKFPNLESIKCNNLTDINGTFDKICKLEVKTILAENFQNLKFPNLKTLSIKCIKNIKNENYWINIIKNIMNIESLQINSIKVKTDQKIILKFIKDFINIKYFEIWYFVEFKVVREKTSNGAPPTYKYEDPMPHNLFIDFDKKIIKSDDIKLSEEILGGQFKNFRFLNYNNSEIVSNFKNLYLRPFESDSDY